MASDREKILAEIDKRSITGGFGMAVYTPDAKALLSLRDWIEKLPAAEEVERWCLYVDGEPNSVMKAYFAANKALTCSLSNSVAILKVAIRRLEDKA
jgi:hypothetical protein